MKSIEKKIRKLEYSIIQDEKSIEFHKERIIKLENTLPIKKAEKDFLVLKLERYSKNEDNKA